MSWETTKSFIVLTLFIIFISLVSLPISQKECNCHALTTVSYNNVFEPDKFKTLCVEHYNGKEYDNLARERSIHDCKYNEKWLHTWAQQHGLHSDENPQFSESTCDKYKILYCYFLTWIKITCPFISIFLLAIIIDYKTTGNFIFVSNKKIQ